MKEEKAPERSLKGMFFVTFKNVEDGKIDIYQQGQVIDILKYEYLLIDKFDWIMGEYYESQLKTFEEMREASFFVDVESMDNWIEKNKDSYPRKPTDEYRKPWKHLERRAPYDSLINNLKDAPQKAAAGTRNPAAAFANC